MEGRLTREPNFTRVGEQRRPQEPGSQLAQSARLTQEPHFQEVPTYRTPTSVPPRPGSLQDHNAQVNAETKARATQAKALYNNLATDPKFAELSYDDQLDVRQRLVTDFISFEQGFADLEPAVQEEVFNSLVLRTPSFKDPQMRQLADQITQRIRENPEDPEIADFITHSHLSNTLLQGNLQRLMRQDPNDNRFDWIGEDRNFVDDALTGSESDKLRRHINTLGAVYNSDIIAHRERTASIRGTVENIGLLGGFILGSAKIIGPMYAAHKLGGAALGAHIGPTTSKLLAWNLPKITTSAVGSLGWVAANEFKDQLTPRSDPIFRGDDGAEMWANARDAFGESLAFSLMASYAFGALGIAAKGIKGASHLWQGKHAAKLTAAEVKNLKAGAITPALQVDESALSLMSRETRFGVQARQFNEQVMQNKQMMNNIRNHPEELTRLLAPNADAWINSTEVKGRKAWEIMREVAPAKDGTPQLQYETVTDLFTLKKRVGELTVDKYRAIFENSGAERAEIYARTNPTAMNWGRAAKMIDNVADARFTLTESPQELRAATEGYVSLVDRSVANPVELEQIKRAIADVKAQAGERSAAHVHQLNLDEASLRAARETGTIAFREGATEGNAFAIAAREATPAQTETIQKLAAKMASSSGIDELTARRLVALDDGFDALRFADGNVEYLFPEKIKMLSAAVDVKTGRVGGVAATRSAPQGLDAAFLTTQHVARAGISADIPLGPATANADLMATAMTSIKGAVGSEALETVRSVSRGFLKQRGADLGEVKVRLSKYANRIDEAGTAARITKSGDGIEITIPKSISRQDAQQRMIRELFDGLDEVAGSKAARKAASFGQQVEKAYMQQSARFVAPIAEGQAKQKWVKSIIENRADGTMTMNPDGTVRVKLPGVRAANFSSVDEAYTRVMDRLWTPEHLRMDLARKGIKLTKTKDGFRATASGWDEPIEAKNIVRLMDKMNYRPERLDSSYAPSVVEITPERVSVAFDGFAYKTTNRQDALQMLGKFEDVNYLARQTGLRSIKNAQISRNQISEIDVTMPDTASRLTFANQDEALAWVRNEMDTIDGFRRIAQNKGLDLDYRSGAWHVSDGRNLHKAHDIPALKRILQQHPDPQAAPDVFQELDPSLVRQLDALYNSGQIKVSARTLPTAGSGTFYEFESLTPGAPVNVGFLKSIGQTIQRKIETFDYVMESQVRPQHPQLYKFYKSMENGRRLAIKSSNDVLNKHLEPAMRRADGKLLTNKQLEKITHYIEADSGDQLEAFVRNHGALTTDEQGFVNAIRATFGRMTEDGVTTGLAHRFGITPEEFIGRYMPRIRDYLQQAPGHEVNRIATADQLLDRVFQGNQKTISQIKPFFENMRTAEISEMARDMNAARLLMKYTSLGHKKLFMNDSWRGMSNYMRLNKDAIDPQMALRINLYRDQIIGVHRPGGYEAVADIGENLWRALKLSDPMGGRQLFEKSMSLNYLTNMAFRPYLAIRNAFQPFTTLAPRFGNANVAKAYKQVGDLGEEYYRFLQGIGLISETPPIINQTHDMNSMMGRVLKKGLAMYKRSDDITRAVAFRTGENLIDDGLAAMNAGRITSRAALRKAIGLNKINPTTADEILFHLDQRTPEGIRRAKNIFGTLLSEETMFAYRPEQMPEIHSRHIIGKMFGQYGTYSAGYRANIYRGLQYGSAADRAAFVTRFVGNQMALFGAFSAAGIQAYNFIPGAPALFSGGPNFDASVNALRAVGDPMGWQGQEALRQLARSYSPVTGQGLNLPRQLPIARHLQWAVDAAEYAQDGDYWKSFLSLTMTPVRRE